MYVWVTLHAVVWGALFASYFTYAADLTPPERRAEGIAVFGVFGLAPNGIAPMLGEAIIARWRLPAFLLTASGFAVLSVALTTLVPVRRPVAARRRHRPARGAARPAVRRGAARACRWSSR